MPDTFQVIAVKLPDPDGSKLQSKYAKDALRTFHANAERCVSLSGFPAAAFMIGMSWSLALQHIGEMEFHGVHPETEGYWDKLVPRALDHVRNKVLKSRNHIESTSPERLAETLIGYGNDLMQMCPNFEYSTAKSAQHLLGATIVAAWGCLEVLTEQLSEGAVASLKFPEFTPQDRRDGVKKGYRSRLAIRENFRIRFKDVDISRILDDPAFSALSLLRNVMAHNAAIADQEFLDSLQESPAWLGGYASLEKGKPVVLTGRLVYELLEKTFSLGYDLIVRVDRKL